MLKQLTSQFEHQLSYTQQKFLVVVYDSFVLNLFARLQSLVLANLILLFMTLSDTLNVGYFALYDLNRTSVHSVIY